MSTKKHKLFKRGRESTVSKKWHPYAHNADRKSTKKSKPESLTINKAAKRGSATRPLTLVIGSGPPQTQPPGTNWKTIGIIGGVILGVVLIMGALVSWARRHRRLERAAEIRKMRDRQPIDHSKKNVSEEIHTTPVQVQTPRRRSISDQFTAITITGTPDKTATTMTPLTDVPVNE